MDPVITSGVGVGLIVGFLIGMLVSNLIWQRWQKREEEIRVEVTKKIDKWKEDQAAGKPWTPHPKDDPAISERHW